MKDILDGEYTGELSPCEVIEQYKYRAGIHLSYIEQLEKGDARYLLGLPDIPTALAFHHWAINGYEEGIRHTEDYISNNVTTIKYCSFGEALATIFLPIIRIFK